jgi:hypothetical protein
MIMKTLEQKIQKITQLYSRQLITESELVAEFVDQIVDSRAWDESKSLQQLLPRTALPALHDFLANLKDSGFLRRRVLIDTSLSPAEQEEWAESLRDAYQRVYAAGTL